MQWLQSNSHRLITPIRLKSRTDRIMVFVLPERDAKFEIQLSRWEINVAVMNEGECWDYLVCIEAIPERGNDGSYRCTLCLDEVIDRYESREQLWVQHMFEPFLEWMNREMATDRAVVMHGITGRTTWANLTKCAESEATKCCLG